MEEIWFKIDGFQFISKDYDYDYIHAKSIWYKATKHMLEKAWNSNKKSSVVMITESMTAQALLKYASRYSVGVIISESFTTNKKTYKFMELIIIIGIIGLILSGTIFKMGGK